MVQSEIVDPAKAIAKMLSKFDEEDKAAFNMLIKLAQSGAVNRSCAIHNRELIYCGTCVADRCK